MKTKSITSANLTQLASALLRSGHQVIAPFWTGEGPLRHLNMGPISSADAMVVSQELPQRSIKPSFLPATEVLFTWKQSRGTVQLDNFDIPAPKTVILLAKPCDAAAPGIVDKVMNWDYQDESWNKRRDSSTIVALACDGGDKSCFCTAVGLGPSSTTGADLLLVPVGDEFEVEVLTPKGQVLVDENASLFSESNHAQQASTFKENAQKKVDGNLALDTAKMSTWLQANFDHAYWNTIALRCHGCGSCASVCPTCHCFDIVDETTGLEGGERRRNWDTCQTGRFTLHGSGHNPRGDQNSRFRQRVMHKFSTYPTKFSATLCTGCGRCQRLCPAGMDLLEILADVNQLAGGVS